MAHPVVILPAKTGVRASYEGETIFSGTGPRMIGLGWSVFPQERRDGRKPARIDGVTLAWKPYIETRPSEELVRRWAAQAPKSNVALILGPASGGLWGLDVDVTDESVALRIMDLALDILGPTPFIRVGNYPKLAMLYRAPVGAEIRSRSYRIHDRDGEPTEHAVEILGPGKSLTVYGLHHKTGQFFKWNDLQPADETPAMAPLADGRRIGAFLDALEREGVSLGNRTSGPPVHSGAFEVAKALKDGELTRPPRTRQGESVVVGKDGKIINGREAYVFARARAWATANMTVPLEVVVQAAYDEACQFVALSGQWTLASLKSRLTEKIRRVRRDIETGRWIPNRHLVDETGKITQATIDAPETPPVKAMLKPAIKRTPLKVLQRTERDPVKAAERALTTDQTRRDREGEAVATGVRSEIRVFLDTVRGGEAASNAIQLLKAPTGAGKTSTLIKMLADEKRAGRGFGGPIVVMMPSHANLEEGADRARRNGGFDAFDYEAAEADKLAGSLGLTALVYKGAARGGCRMSEHKKLLGEAQIASGNLCKSTSKDIDGSAIVRKCQFYDECPVIRQRALAKAADIIFMPHVFLSLPMPSEITESAKGLVIDESVWMQLAKSTVFPLSALRAVRPLPKLTKAERKVGVEAEDMVQQRELAADIAIAALEKGECPAAALAAKEHGLAWVESAWAVVSRTQEAARAVFPGMPLEAVRSLAMAPKSQSVWEEARFWRIVKERIEAIRHDALIVVDPETGISSAEPKAKGDRDMRIQMTSAGVRISWRVVPNLARLPLLLMDASGEKRLVEKLWGGRPVIEKRIDAKLHVRVIAGIDRSWSDRNFSVGETAKSRIDASENVTLLRDAIGAVAFAHGAGHVLVGTTMSTRKKIQDGWAEPDNVDFGHFGAFRGLDFAHAHSAALAVGRMELPIQTIDGLVAALTFDDEDPERPMDIRGDGLQEDGTPIRPAMGERAIRHRDGSDWLVRVQEHRGEVARLVQRQFREEELKQFLGRLRPIYRRGEAPVVYVCTNCIPEDWVVDEFVSLKDIARPDVAGIRWTEAARRTGVVDAFAWSEDAGDVVGRQDAEAAIGRMGEAMEPLTVSVRATVMEHDNPIDLLVPATVEGVDSAVREHLRRRGFEPDSVQVLRDIDRITPAGRKAPDKVDAELGDRRLRRDREVLLRERTTAKYGPPDGTWRELVVDGRKRTVHSDVAIQYWKGEPDE